MQSEQSEANFENIQTGQCPTGVQNHTQFYICLLKTVQRTCQVTLLLFRTVQCSKMQNIHLHNQIFHIKQLKNGITWQLKNNSQKTKYATFDCEQKNIYIMVWSGRSDTGCCFRSILDQHESNTAECSPLLLFICHLLCTVNFNAYYFGLQGAAL